MQWTCKPSDLKGQRIGIKLANETTTSCQLVQNFIVCAVATFKTLLFVQSRHSKLYCLCSRDIQNFIVCAVETFETLLFVQSRHSKLYCLCSQAIRNFLVCVSLLGLRKTDYWEHVIFSFVQFVDTARACSKRCLTLSYTGGGGGVAGTKCPRYFQRFVSSQRILPLQRN